MIPSPAQGWHPAGDVAQKGGDRGKGDGVREKGDGVREKGLEQRLVQQEGCWGLWLHTSH